MRGDDEDKIMLEYERPGREQRYEAAALFYSFRSARFQPPRISKAAADRLKQALNNTPALEKNERHEAVKVLQQALIDLRDWRVQIADGATGFFGQQTEDALRAFQKAYKLVKRDGKAGNETLGRLDQVLSVPDPPPNEDILFCPAATSIPRIKQPYHLGCWATTATMMYFWKHNPSDVPGTIPDIRIRYVLDHTSHSKEQWLELYTSERGLPSGENFSFLSNGLHMQLVSSQPNSDYFHRVGFWTSHLRRSPLALNTLRTAVDATNRNHFIIVYGIKGFVRGNSILHFIDSGDGLDHEQPLWWVARLMGWVDNAHDDNQFRDRIFSW